MNFLNNPPEVSSVVKPVDKEQMLRVQRGIYVLLGALVYTITCLLIWNNGYLHVSGREFLVLFSVIWAGYLSYFLIIKTGLNKRFQDPDMSMSIVFWAISSIMVTVSLTTEIRALLLMFNLLVLVFAAFYLNKQQYIIVTIYGIAFYIGVILYLNTFYPTFIIIKEEAAVLMGYVFLATALALICYKMSMLRKKLYQKNKKLAVAIKHVGALSMTDELTKVKNRRYILDILHHQALLAERGQYYFAVCMLDIDHFKLVNDTYGHLVGDKVLKALCNKVLEILREIDYFARIGGEEFLVVLPLLDQENAVKTADRIRSQIENASFNDITSGLKITISIGIVVYESPEKIETTLARVDAALYAAKRAGRNRVEFQ